MCVCSLCFYFADVFSSTMSSDLRAAVVLQGSGVLQSLPSSLPDAALASRVHSTYAKFFSSYNSWRFWAREHGLTVFPASPFHVAIYLCHLMTEAKTASSLESAVHSIAWFHHLGGEASPSDHPFGEEYSCRCAAFAGPSNNQEGAFHSLSVRAVSCLQGLSLIHI